VNDNEAILGYADVTTSNHGSPAKPKQTIVIGVIIVLAVVLDVIRRGEIEWLRLPGLRSG